MVLFRSQILIRRLMNSMLIVFWLCFWTSHAFAGVAAYRQALETINDTTRLFSDTTKLAIAPRYYALIVGIDNYQELEPLQYCVKDAIAMSQVLTDEDIGLVNKENMTILSNEQATRETILRVLASYKSILRPNDIFIIYWSGRSIKSTNQDELYLVPFDGTQDTVIFTAIKLNAEVVSYFSKDNTLIFLGDIGETTVNTITPNVTILTSTNDVEQGMSVDNLKHGAFTYHLLDSLRQAEDLDRDGFLSVDECYNDLYPRVVKSMRGRLHPTLIGRYPYQLHIVRSLNNQDNQAETILAKEYIRESFAIDSQILQQLFGYSQIWINGKMVDITEIDTKESSLEVQYLGNERTANNLFQPGLNYITLGESEVRSSITDNIKEKIRFLYLWKERNQLKEFVKPYKDSHAIIVAIGDYKRKKDSLKRGDMGLDETPFMVNHAEELRNVLTTLGFSEDRIHTFYDEQATSENIQSMLKSFWKGGRFESADRLIFYFGGHGYEENGNGYLVTYDFDANKPDFTALSMEDLTTTYSRKITANHMLIALDACYSGLAIPSLLGSDSQEIEIPTLKLIKADVEQQARNVLVAGTGEQKALYEKGGVFTRYLIEGLKGAADKNSDKIIQFQELESYVRNQVIIKASDNNVTQIPKAYTIERFGEGRILFTVNP